MFLTVTDLIGFCEPLYDVKSLKLIEEVNGDYSLSFLIFNSDRNVHAYPLVKEESLVEHNGVEYRIKKVEEQNIGNRSMKSVSARHTMFELIDNYVYGTLTGTRTLTQALNFLFEGSGYTYAVTDIFSSEDVGDEFGDDNSLSLLQKALGLYQAEYEINGTHFTFRQQIGNQTDTQFRYKHNIKAINKSIDSSSLSTYIKGYGKPKEEKDVLSGTSIPYSSRSGTYYTDPGLNKLATEKIGANFKFSFVGTGFNFKTIVTFLGGVWEFTIDGSQSVKISTYEDLISKDKTFEVIRGLENKAHNVVATFKGKDSKNPYTKLKSDPAPIVYLKSGNIIGLYRELVGDEQYTVTGEYISPNASKFPNPFSEDGYKHADPVYDERITSKTTLINKLKKNIQDKPELSITVDFVDLRNAGYPYQHPNKGDEILLIYEPMNLDMAVRIMRIEEEEDAKGNIISCAVTLANFGKSVGSVMTSFSQTSKRISKILTDDDKVKFDFLDEAVKRATAALQSAQTELEFNNGIIAREKTNPNELVLFNSQGIGISTDSGQTFKTAMTAEGIVADVITAGTIRGIIIEGVEIYGSTIISESSGTRTEISGGDFHSSGKFTRTFGKQLAEYSAFIDSYDGALRARITEKKVNGVKVNSQERWLAFTDKTLTTQREVHSGSVDYKDARFIDFFADETLNSDVAGLSMHIYSGQNLTLESQYNMDIKTRPENYVTVSGGGVAIESDSGNGMSIRRKTQYTADSGTLLSFQSSAKTWQGAVGIPNNQRNMHLTSYFGDYIILRSVAETHIKDVNNNSFMPIRASEYRNGSSITYKTNISDLECSGLGIINNLALKQYLHQSDVDNGVYYNWQVGVISELSPEIATPDGLSVNVYKMLSYAAKAIQELSGEVNQLKSILSDFEMIMEE